MGAQFVKLCKDKVVRDPLFLSTSIGYNICLINLHLMDELSILEERIQDKITETKIKIDKTAERAETDLLWPIIVTLNWVLN